MIVINDLTFKYKNNLIFDHTSLTLPDKGVIILGGDNGSGKSTLLKILAGDLLSDNIKLEYNNILINETNKNEFINHITYISQTNNFVSFLNASENASINNLIHKNNIKELKLLDNEIFKNRKEIELSNGEKILVTLERAINENKNIILLDECSDFLDDYNTNILIENIKKLSNNSLIIIVSHDERIINAFPKHINIKNKKLIINYTCENTSNYINNFIDNDEGKKSISYLSKKLIKKHYSFIVMFSLLLLLFNSVFLTGLSLLNYPFSHSYSSCLEENYYQLFDTSKRIIKINNDDFVINTTLFSSKLKTKQKEKVLSDFDVEYLTSLGEFTISNGHKINKAKISSKEYEELLESSDIQNDKLILSIHDFNTRIYIPFEIIDDEETNKFGIIINKNDFDIIEYHNSISVNGALWENDNLPFNKSDSIKKLLSVEAKLTFLTKEMYEEKYNVTLENDISNDEIYISHTLDNLYHTNNKLKFFDFSNENMEWYSNLFLNLNEVFDNAYLKTDFPNNRLIGNDVIISDFNYKKLSSLIDLVLDPYIYLTKSNLNIIKRYYCENIKLSKDPFLTYNKTNNYSLSDFYKFQDLYNENVTFYSILLVLLLIPELSIIYIVIKGYKVNVHNDFLIIMRYFNKKETSFIFSIPYLLSLITSFIVSLLGSTLLLKIIFKNLEFSIMPFKINIISIIILFMLNALLYFFMKAIKNK